MAQALSEEEFQRMQVPLAGEKTTGLGDGRAGKRKIVPPTLCRGWVGWTLSLRGWSGEGKLRLRVVRLLDSEIQLGSEGMDSVSLVGGRESPSVGDTLLRLGGDETFGPMRGTPWVGDGNAGL